VVAAVISYQHAFELVRSHGETGVTARLLPFTVDGLIWAASMVVLNASRRNQPVPRLAAWNLGTGIVATVGANLAHGIGHGLISAWPALALVGSFELLMMLTRTGRGTRVGDTSPGPRDQAAPPLAQEAPPELPAAPTPEHTVRARHRAARSQRAIAPRTQPRPPQGQTHPRPNGMTQLTDLELRHSMRHCRTDLARSLSAVLGALGREHKRFSGRP
jgi:hypothetical protein